MNVPGRALLVRHPSALPFNGHLRVRRAGAGGTLLVAARVAGSAAPEEAWATAEAARAALGAVGAKDRYGLINAAWQALRPFDTGDLVALLLAWDPDGVTLTACGLGAVWVDGRPLVPPEHPLLGPPGVPERTGYYAEDVPGDTYVGVPGDQPWRWADVEHDCGVRRWA